MQLITLQCGKYYIGERKIYVDLRINKPKTMSSLEKPQNQNWPNMLGDLSIVSIFCNSTQLAKYRKTNVAYIHYCYLVSSYMRSRKNVPRIGTYKSARRALDGDFFVYYYTDCEAVYPLGEFFEPDTERVCIETVHRIMK